MAQGRTIRRGKIDVGSSVPPAPSSAPGSLRNSDKEKKAPVVVSTLDEARSAKKESHHRSNSGSAADLISSDKKGMWWVEFQMGRLVIMT